jgi:regulator of sigma E protease
MSAVYFLLLLGGLIFFHELGHFLLAKATGVRVLTFSIGFGPALLKKTIGDTEYKIAAIPLGGYVRMHGDEPGQEVPSDERDVAFNYKPLWARSLIVLAGPVFNLVLPLIIFFFIFLSHGELFPAYVGAVSESGPAWNAGIRSGDTIVSINGQEVEFWWQMQRQINSSIGEELELEVRRGNETFVTKVTPEEAEVVLLPQVNLTRKEGRIQVTQYYVEPAVGVKPHGIAWNAGLRNWDRIISMDGEPVLAWAELERHLTRPGTVTLEVIREETMGTVGHGLLATLGNPWTVTLECPGGKPDETLGVWSAEMVVHHVDENTPAAEAGLKSGDHILTVNGYVYPLWKILESELIAGVEDEHTITWFDGEQERKAAFSLVPKEEKGEFNEARKVVIFGAYNHSALNLPTLIPNTIRMTYTMTSAWTETVNAFRITIASVGGLVRGRVPVSDMGGPILIYDMASRTEEEGWLFFFNLMAVLSISLGVINLFPIPILDGGHLVFFAIEAIIRREVPMMVRQIASYVGLVMILTLMVVVFYNDIIRMFGL